MRKIRNILAVAILIAVAACDTPLTSPGAAGVGGGPGSSDSTGTLEQSRVAR